MQTVLAISGSLRTASYNRRLLRAAATMPSPAAQLVEFDGLADLPPYNEDHDGDPAPAAVARLRAAIAAADALVIATPEYNGSLPGQLKNALDWASRPYPDNALRDKPAAVIGASTGLFGAVWAQADARRILDLIGARVLDRELPVPNADELFGPDGELLDDHLAGALAELLGDLLAQTERVVCAA
jgi:chromate reductase